MFEYDMGMHDDSTPDSAPEWPAADSSTAPDLAELGELIMAGAGACPASVRRLVADLLAVCQEDLIGDLATGLADRFTVLGRVRAVLDAEVGRTGAAAQTHDVLPHTPTTQLQREAHWSGTDASAVMVAGRFVDRHPRLAHMWRTGRVSTAAVAVIARGMRGLTHANEMAFLNAVGDQLPQLSVRSVKVLLSRTLDLLHPNDTAAREQTEWDRRSLGATTHGGMTMITADLPGLEGQAVMAALDALADSLQVAGDRSTAAQRRADALITLVNRAAAHNDLPATRSGLPVATTITVGVSEADRVAAGYTTEATKDLTADLTGNRDPGATATSASGTALTLGDAALRFALCAGSHTPVLLDDHKSNCTTTGPVSAALGKKRLQPLAVGRAHRFATPAQRTALALRDGGCILCHRPPAECQAHHLTDWAVGGETNLDEMVLLCWTHHRQVDLNRWHITRNPDPSPGQPHWLTTPVPRHQWRRRQPSPHAA